MEAETTIDIWFAQFVPNDQGPFDVIFQTLPKELPLNISDGIEHKFRSG
jgi:hypothetical protein